VRPHAASNHTPSARAARRRSVAEVIAADPTPCCLVTPGRLPRRWASARGSRGLSPLVRSSQDEGQGPDRGEVGAGGARTPGAGAPRPRPASRTAKMVGP
jgi:hypothetical protein